MDLITVIPVEANQLYARPDGARVSLVYHDVGNEDTDHVLPTDDRLSGVPRDIELSLSALAVQNLLTALLSLAPEAHAAARAAAMRDPKVAEAVKARARRGRQRT